MWTFLILEFLPKYSPGTAKPEHRWKGPMDLPSGRSLGCKLLFKPWSIRPPENTHPVLRKRKSGKAQNSQSLHKKELSPHQI